MTSIPAAPTEPDPVRSSDWLGEAVGDSIAGTVLTRETKKSEKFGTVFEVLTIKAVSGDEFRVPCARSHLAQLVGERDPQPGDGLALTFFGRPDDFTYLYGMAVTRAGATAGAADAETDDDIPF